ncbi:MAG: LysR family transcriptional regulator [Acidobacteriota bacterium]|nr:LysR family transcriptional regulator [Acidobacteriota bacterium]MDQ7086423.1 LysR family transcriptional regulator [Acidobacteriota bacterium]
MTYHWNSLSLDRVRAFVAVARTGTFRQAAALLHLSQPAVSMAVAALEEEIGLVLLEKAGRRKALTEAGRAFLEPAAALLEQWQDLPGVVSARLSGRLGGRLRIGAGEAVSLYRLPAVLAAFRRRHPQVQVHLSVQPRRHALEQLRVAEIDLAIRSAGDLPEDLAYTEVWRTPRVVIAPPATDLPARPGVAALARYPFVLPPPPARSRALVEAALAGAGKSLQVGAEAGGWEVIKAAVGAGLGLAVVPFFCLRPAERRRLRVLRPRPAFPPESYGVIHRASTALPAAARHFADHLKAKG